MSDNHQKTTSSASGQRLHKYKYDSLQDIIDGETTDKENGFGSTCPQIPKENEDVEMDCLIDNCNRFSTPVIFISLITPLYAVMVGTSTYFGGCISTIEKQFQLTSYQSGLLATVNDIVSLSIVVFVTYYGSKSHRPRVIGVSCMIVAAGSFLLSLPHFTSDPILYSDNNYMTGNNSNDYLSNNYELCSVDDVAQDRCTSGEVAGAEPPSLFWMICGQILLGLGGAPIFPLTITYLDDSTVDSTTTSIYIAGLFVAMGLGPLLGFVLSFKCLSLYVDFERINKDNIPTNQRDPRWIGAWWLGFVIASVLIVVLAIPILLFPRKLKKYEINCCGGRSKRNENGGDFNMGDIYKQNLIRDKQNGILKSVKELFTSLKRLLYNPTLVLLNLTVSCDLAIVGGFAFFIAKYVETQFAVSAATAAIIIGGINLPGTVFGNIFSSYCVKRFKLTQYGLGRMLILLAVCSVCFATPLLFIGCSNPGIAGVTTLYNTTSGQGSLPNLNNSCNSNCACSEAVYRPVCGYDGITYTSACRAGCTDVLRDGMDNIDELPTNETVYIGCSCIANGEEWQNTDGLIEGGLAREGLCDWSCDKLFTFVFFIAVVSFFTSLRPNPGMMLSLRCVNQGDRALAIAFGGVVIRVLGFFPAPIYFGSLIASTCLVRQESCSREGACLIYDLERYRYSFIGLFLGLKLLGAILSICTYLSINPDRLQKNKCVESSTELSQMDSKR